VTPPTRFVDYLRLSTTDRQDPALSFPSQHKANERKAVELGGEIVCSFEDQASGAKADRPGWTALMAEARDRENRRFDAVLCYSTSRLARDKLLAALYERELKKVGVHIAYATGAADTSTPEGQMFVGMQQLWDQFERDKLARETRRGQREGIERGWRMGGRAPYGYRRQGEALPEGHRGDTSKQRVKLVPEPDEATVVTEIFHLHASQGWGLKAIASHLNRPGGPPSPSHVDKSRNRGGHWATSTLRSMLRNPVYTGRLVWNRLDCATARQHGGTPHLRAEEEWVISPDTHAALISDETFKHSQERFKTRPRKQHTNRVSKGSRYMFAGLVYCVSGHQPLAMQGKTRKGHVYHACGYSNSYGDTAATEIHAGQKWVSLREDTMLPLAEQFFKERVWGPLRHEKLTHQLNGHNSERKRSSQLLVTRLHQQIASADRNLAAQVRAIEAGVDIEVVKARIEELKADKQAAQTALDAIPPAERETEDNYLLERLARIPDLTQQLRDATHEIKRLVFQAFELRIEFDKAQRHIALSATITEAVARALENTRTLHSKGLMPEELVPVNGSASTGWKHPSTTVHRIEEPWTLDSSGTSFAPLIRRTCRTGERRARG
jgi:DNA invertase Pin-like site-specific DNA recombinase